MFTYINEKRKLNIIKYSKALQKILNIKLFNYRVLSGKYIINQEKDNWKIYNLIYDNLEFEGNYINGVGKEYYKDGKYEGEYLNGKRNGNFKIYSHKGKLIRECVYKNGLENGKFIDYYNDGKVLTKGEYLNGNEWNTEECDKEGNIINKIKNGKGILTQ